MTKLPALLLALCLFAADGRTQFAVDLHKTLKPANENQLFSPISVSAALTLLEAGARGETAEQIRKALHLTDDAKRHETLGTLLRSLGRTTKKDAAYDLAIANRLWIQSGLDVQKPFLAMAKDHFGAAVENVDYLKDPEAARQLINKWVEGETHEKIKDLLPNGILGPLTRLVLVNAIYFRGAWEFAFDKKLTREADFFSAKDVTVKAPLMYQAGKFGYAETADAQVLELPFKSREISMVVILPKAKDGLAKFEEGLTGEALAKLTGDLRARGEIQVHLPRFKMECESNLNDALGKLGMVEAFSGGADFSGITGDKSLCIAAVLHKAFIEVNEEGAEAAAATAAVLHDEGAPDMPRVFRADRPFLFLIRDVKAGTILFQGRLVKP